jgi:large subunit ribosomal protein L3
VKGIVGKKLGMTQVFDEETGQVTSVTVIEAGPCPVVSVKQVDVDGYDAVQVAYGEVAEHRLSKPKLGHLKKNNVAPHRHLLELRGLTGATEGESVTVESFEPGDKVKVSGVSIGKGFAGTIKRHHFSRGPTSHGSHNIRQPGSVGASADPARIFPGQKMPGQMGNKGVTVKNLQVVAVDAENNELWVRGGVPGGKGSVVKIRKAGE